MNDYRTTDAEGKFHIATNHEGKCRIPEAIAPGEIVLVEIDVENPPHYDFLPLKGFTQSNERDIFILAEGENYPPQIKMEEVFDFTKLKTTITGPFTVEVEFEMPPNIPGHITLGFYVEQGGSLIRGATGQDWATADRKQRSTLKIQLSAWSSAIPISGPDDS